MKKWLVSTSAFAGLTLLAASAIPASANQAPPKPANFPDRPINLVVSYPAGGGMDITARTLATQLERVTGYQFRVQDRAGGGNIVGNTYVAREAKPNGYTIGILANPSFFIDILNRGAHFRKDDISPIAGINFAPAMWVTRTNSPMGKLKFKGIIDYARKHPDKLKVGVIPRSSFDFVARIIEREKHVKFTIVPFQGGKPSIVSLLGGNINVSSNYYSEVESYIKSGKLKPVAVANTKREKEMPHTPAMSELGIKIAPNTWGAVRFAAVPKGTPKAIQKYLSYIIVKTLNQKQTQKAFAKVGINVETLNMSQEQKAYNGSYQAVKAYLKQAGMLKMSKN